MKLMRLFSALVLMSGAFVFGASGVRASGQAAQDPKDNDQTLRAMRDEMARSKTRLELKIPGIVTTYITGTWTSLLTGLVRFARQEREHTTGQDPGFEERLLMQAGVLSVYFLSVVLTGWFFRHLPLAVGVLPGLSVLLVAVHGLIYSD